MFALAVRPMYKLLLCLASEEEILMEAMNGRCTVRCKIQVDVSGHYFWVLLEEESGHLCSIGLWVGLPCHCSPVYRFAVLCTVVFHVII